MRAKVLKPEECFIGTEPYYAMESMPSRSSTTTPSGRAPGREDRITVRAPIMAERRIGYACLSPLRLRRYADTPAMPTGDYTPSLRSPWRVATVSCHDDLTASDLIGHYPATGGEIVWVDGRLAHAVRSGETCHLGEGAGTNSWTSAPADPWSDPAYGS